MQLQTNIQLPEEHIKIEARNVKAFIGNNDCGKGTLAIAESNLVWKQENGDNGFCFEYPHIGLFFTYFSLYHDEYFLKLRHIIIAIHAISNDRDAFPDSCLYLILDKNASEPNHDFSSDGDDDNDDEDSENVNEIRFVPEDKSLLSLLFQAMNECQALYPDNSMSGDEFEEEDGGEEVEEDGNENEEFEVDNDRNEELEDAEEANSPKPNGSH